MKVEPSNPPLFPYTSTRKILPKAGPKRKRVFFHFFFLPSHPRRGTGSNSNVVFRQSSTRTCKKVCGNMLHIRKRVISAASTCAKQQFRLMTELICLSWALLAAGGDIYRGTPEKDLPGPFNGVPLGAVLVYLPQVKASQNSKTKHHLTSFSASRIRSQEPLELE